MDRSINQSEEHFSQKEKVFNFVDLNLTLEVIPSKHTLILGQEKSLSQLSNVYLTLINVKTNQLIGFS